MEENPFHQGWIYQEDTEDDDVEDIDSDSSEYQRELEVALYCQIHHETVREPCELDNEFSVEKVEEKNGKVISSKSDFSQLGSNENCTMKGTAQHQPISAQMTEGSQKPHYSVMKDFLTISNDSEVSLPRSSPKTTISSPSDLRQKPEILTVSSDLTSEVTDSDTDVIVVEKHLICGVPVPPKKHKMRKKPKVDLIDLTAVDSSDTSSSDSDVLQEIMDSETDDNIVLNINNKGGRKIVLDAAELSDYEEVCTLKQDSNWNIIDSDKYASQYVDMGRYYGPPKVRCNNCNERGHLSKDCPKPKKRPVCILCGIEGHISRHCPSSLCHNCSEPGHNSKDCTKRRYRDTDQCFRCQCWGHLKFDCSDLWRQYHSTTRPGALIKSKENQENKRMYCFNCGEEGHFGHECNEEMMYRWNKLPFCPWVTKYDNVERWKDKKREHADGECNNPGKRRRTDELHGNEKRRKVDTPSAKDSRTVKSDASLRKTSKHAFVGSSGQIMAKREKAKKKEKLQRKFEVEYGTDTLPRSHNSVHQAVEKKMKNKKKVKGRHTELLSAANDDVMNHITKRQGKKGKREWTGKNEHKKSRVTSKWNDMPSKKGNWTYKGKGKKQGDGGRGQYACGNNGKKGFQSKKGFNFKAY